MKLHNSFLIHLSKNTLHRFRGDYSILENDYRKRQSSSAVPFNGKTSFALSPLVTVYRGRGELKLRQKKLRWKDQLLDDDTFDYTYEEWMTEKLAKNLKELKELKCAVTNLKMHPLFDTPFNQLRKLKIRFPRRIERKYNLLRSKRETTADYAHCNRKLRLLSTGAGVRSEVTELLKRKHSHTYY